MIKKKLNAYCKNLVLLCRPHLYLGWSRSALSFISNTLSLSLWIAKNRNKDVLNDFFHFKRNYGKRYELYQYLIDKMAVAENPIDYLEFGVFSGNSIKWWAEHISNPDARFYGFDTFEGLPENWGSAYKKGDMYSNIPQFEDNRITLIKGLFQDTLHQFLHTNDLHHPPKIIHMDADLFSSTLFVLTSMAPYLHAGDVLIFDEFNVPNHEFLAFKIFTESYYIKTKLIGAVNNYYQVAFVVE